MYALEEKQIRRPDILENRINADKNCLLFEVLYKIVHVHVIVIVMLQTSSN